MNLPDYDPTAPPRMGVDEAAPNAATTIDDLTTRLNAARDMIGALRRGEGGRGMTTCRDDSIRAAAEAVVAAYRARLEADDGLEVIKPREVMEIAMDALRPHWPDDKPPLLAMDDDGTTTILACSNCAAMNREKIGYLLERDDAVRRAEKAEAKHDALVEAVEVYARGPSLSDEDPEGSLLALLDAAKKE